MFLVPFNKKRILDSTLSSQEEQGEQKQQQQQQQEQHKQLPNINQSTNYSGSTNSHSTTNETKSLNNKFYNHHFNPENLNGKQSFIRFILGSTHFLNRIFIKSLATLRQCLHISIQTIFAILNSITNQCTELLISGRGGGGGGSVTNHNSSGDSTASVGRLACWPLAICSSSGSPSSGSTCTTTTTTEATSNYLRALAKANNWSEAAAAAIAVVGSSQRAERNRNETIYYGNQTDSSEPHCSNSTEAATADLYRCDTIEMDFCRRRITQRAASNSHHGDVSGPPTTTTSSTNKATSCHWDYQAPPAAGSSAQTCTSVGDGPQVSGDENKGTSGLCRQLRREQVRHQFQGQQEEEEQQRQLEQQQQQRSYGLQMEMRDCRRECSQQQQQQQQQQQIILPQPKQQELQRSLLHDHHAQISKSSQYSGNNFVVQPSYTDPSTSSSDPPHPASFMSTNHNSNLHHHHQQHQNHHHLQHQQQQRRQDGHRNGSMNINAHSQQEIEQQQQQQQNHQRKHEPHESQLQGATTARVVVAPNGTSSMILVSKDTISNLTDQIALSMNKMKELEEQVRVIPELQRRLDNVISDSNSSSVSDSNHHLTYIGVGNGENSSSSGGGISRNINNRNNSNLYLNNHHKQHNNSQDFSFSTDSVAPFYGSGCNINSSSSSSVNQLRANNTNRATYSDELFRGIHPSLQRHYNSFRSSTNNSNSRTRDASCFSIKDSALIASQTTTGSASNYSMRSPLSGSRHLNCNNGAAYSATSASLTNNHLTGNNINPSRQSLSHSIDHTTTAAANTNNNMLRSNQNLAHTNRSSSPKVEYEDLINDLISLSYSVNYPSSTTNSSQDQSTFGSNSVSGSKLKDKSPNHQVREQSTNKTHADHDNQQAGSKRSSPSLSKLDCGCQSFREHLRYNSISREQRMQQHTRSQSVSYNNNNNNNINSSATSNNTTATSLQSTPTHNGYRNNFGGTNHNHSSSSRQDASTNTDLSMGDIVTKVELDNLVSTMQKTYSTLSSIASRDEIETPDQFRSSARKSSPSFGSDGGSSSGSMSGPKSLSPQGSRSTNSRDEDEEQARDDNNDDDGLSDSSNSDLSKSNNKGSLDENDNHPARSSPSSSSSSQASDDREEADIGDGECNRSEAGSLNCEEGPYSLGSSYQDPSDFEEYCAYGESLDRRTKDFMSQSTKIPNDLRFALIRLNDFLKRNRSYEQIQTTSGCIEVIRKEWFEVAANKDSQPIKTKLYVDYFESFTKQLLNTVVNLSDNAGNTAMHYAASLFKMDIIKVLLDTKVCDINCRNKAGYTPIMLLALADITTPEEQEIARQLFSMGDVNIKARTNGQTAIMLAASHGRISTCRLLLECGADPSLQDYDGSTALMCGSEIGHEEVVRCLLAHKLTDPNAVDNDGLDALSIAMNNGHKNIGLILYAAKNVPRMVRSAATNSSLYNNTSGGYLGASLRRSRGKVATNYVRRADSLLGSRSSRLMRNSSQT